MGFMKFGMVATAMWASLVAGIAGCASGGFKLTRQYAGFVNRQPLILRIIIYIFTSVVFAVTLLIDMVLFNTMDFWEGRVSAGDYQFQKDGRQYVAHHRHLENGLRESRIEIFEGAPKKIQEVILRETKEAQIDIFVDGVLKATVDNINSVPSLRTFDVKGDLISARPLFGDVLARN